jgi:hypothetical protein
MPTDTQAQQDALRAQRTKDLQLAAASTNPAGAAHDRAQAAALRTQIQDNARANNAASTTANTPPASTAAIDPATGYAYGSAEDSQTLAAQTTTNTNNAVASISSTLSSLGLGAMEGWATSAISALVGKGIDPSTAVNTVISQMNNPQNADGSVNQDALDAFNAALPGFNQRIATTGNNGSPGASPAQAIANYIQYGTQIQQYEQTAGLPPGTLDPTAVGNLWANDVSTDEVSTRLTTDYANAANAWNNIPGFKDAMAQQGMTSLGQLVGYYINPTNTLQQINQQISAGQLGAESGATGFGAISGAQSNALSAFLTNSGQNQLTTTQANAAFTSNLGNNVQGSAAALAAGGYEQAGPGQSNTGVVSQDTLLAGIEGNASALQQTEHAQEARTAGAKGGGGTVVNAGGATGLGYASS